MHGWISVEDRQPPKMKWVRVAHKKDVVFLKSIGFYTGTGWYSMVSTTPPTHWKPGNEESDSWKGALK